ncbi:MAG TPA: hypothetical protein VJO53_09815 [Candidatus Acidoferrales bacterium]|nr:hypothetical protein [Candidatus Acidoferrales bacterium]
MDPLTAVATLAGTAIGLGTLATGVWQYRRKVHLEIFRVYADKYNAILTPEIYEIWLDAIRGERTHWGNLTPAMIMYLNLIWEELFLARDGAIPRRLWGVWLPEIKKVLSSEFAKVVLESCEFHFPPELTCGSALEHDGILVEH